MKEQRINITNNNQRTTWKKFKQNKSAYYSFKILIFLLFIALIAPFVATDLPWYCNYKGVKMFPAFSLSNSCQIKNEKGEQETLQYDITDWKRLDASTIIFAPIAYCANKTDYENADYVSPSAPQKFTTANGEKTNMPLKFRHWLGTNKAGEDVLSGLINGTRVSLLIGILSMLIASIIGITTGAMAGYFGDKKLQSTRGVCCSLIVGSIVAYYYGFFVRTYHLKDALSFSAYSGINQLLISLLIFSSILVLFYLLGRTISKLSLFNKLIFIPVDTIISRIIEILISMPLIILIISIAAMSKEKSMLNLILIIGLTSWTSIARLTRAEFLRISKLEYIQAAQSMGYNELRVIFKHALPNAIAPALVAIAFGVSSSILIESSLSFLGIGVSGESVTWGYLLNSGREEFSAWWLVLFPGLAIFITITIFNLLGDGLRAILKG